MENKTENNPNKWCSLSEASDMLGMTYQTTRRRVLEGVLEYKKDGREYLVNRKDVEELAKELENNGKKDENQDIKEMEIELRVSREQNRMLKEQIDMQKERIKDLEEDKGFLLNQIEEKDRVISELMPKALPKPKQSIGEKIKGLFRRQDTKQLQST